MRSARLATGALAVLMLPAAFILALSPGDSAASAPLVPGDTGQLNVAALPAQARQWAPWVIRAGQMCPEVSPPLIAAQIHQESGWHTDAVGPVTSRGAQARGIAQFMPGTWPSWGQDEDGNGTSDPLDAPDAIMAMGRFDCALARSLAKIPGDKTANMLAGYNAGPGAVQQYNGVPPYAETQAYVSRIKDLIVRYSQVTPPAGGASVFGATQIAAARKYLGTPYVWGGGGPHGPTIGGFDCSGLVLYAVYQASQGRISLPHQANLQATMGQHVERARMQPGDVVAFKIHNSYWDHIGIYLGNNQLLHAPRTGDVVKVESLDNTYWKAKPWEVRRYG